VRSYPALLHMRCICRSTRLTETHMRECESMLERACAAVGLRDARPAGRGAPRAAVPAGMFSAPASTGGRALHPRQAGRSRALHALRTQACQEEKVQPIKKRGCTACRRASWRARHARAPSGCRPLPARATPWVRAAPRHAPCAHAPRRACVGAAARQGAACPACLAAPAACRSIPVTAHAVEPMHSGALPGTRRTGSLQSTAPVNQLPGGA